MVFDFEKGAIIPVDKPYRWTSFDVIGSLRGFFRKELGVEKFKIGHAGTLDPLATGLLLLCTGPTTKRIEELQELEKEYTGTFVIGGTTLCFDLEKPLNQLFNFDHLTHRDIEETAKHFVGDIMQVPPLFSAIKVNGKRAYKSARSGKELELSSRQVKISAFEVLRIALPEVDFRIRCSKGTYIRSLVRDFGNLLNSGAYLSALCRTRIGSYRLEDAWSIQGLKTVIKNQLL